MSAFGRTLTVARHTYREATRQRVLYALAAVASMVMVSGLLLKGLTLRQEGKILQDQGLATAEFISVLVAIVLSCDLLSREIEQKTVHAVLATRLRRWEFIVGRFAGLLAILVVVVLAMGLGAVVALAVSGNQPGSGFPIALFAILLGAVLVSSIGIFLSSMAGRTVAIVGTVSAVIAGRLSDTLANLPELLPNVPAWIGSALYLVLPNFRNFDLKNHAVYGDPISLQTVAWITVYALTYSTLLLTLAIAAFRRRDLT